MPDDPRTPPTRTPRERISAELRDEQDARWLARARQFRKDLEEGRVTPTTWEEVNATLGPPDDDDGPDIPSEEEALADIEESIARIDARLEEMLEWEEARALIFLPPMPEEIEAMRQRRARR